MCEEAYRGNELVGDGGCRQIIADFLSPSLPKYGYRFGISGSAVRVSQCKMRNVVRPGHQAGEN